MALPTLRDLSDHRDVKGGSPRTPSGGVRVADYQEYVAPVINGNHIALWKMLASGGWGAAAGILIAYFTAMQSKGVTTKEMQDFDKEYSLYAKPTTPRQRHLLNPCVNEQSHNSKDSHRSGHHRVVWSDFSGFPSVRMDARHNHPARRKGKTVNLILMAIVVILILCLYYLLDSDARF